MAMLRLMSHVGVVRCATKGHAVGYCSTSSSDVYRGLYHEKVQRDIVVTSEAYYENNCVAGAALSL